VLRNTEYAKVKTPRRSMMKMKRMMEAVDGI
jgi:hypothetical protein